MNNLLVTSICLGLLVSACGNSEKHLFESIDPTESNLNFSNNLHYDRDFNIFRYRNFYNGGGVGLIDFNKDGLLDIYMTANMDTNRLYQNLGDFRFKDVTASAGVGGTRSWSTGVTVADIDADGWPDIYVCNSGDIKGDDRKNELFINNGDGSFTEAAAAYGIDDEGFSIHASFFDYDRDGDLDMYLLNNSYRAIGSFDQTENLRHVRDSIGGDKLFRNDQGMFVDVSTEAGIYGSVIGFGLGVTVADINRDDWLDIYISNDFFERDYLYINNQQGGFDEKLEEQIKAISAASMGADIADLNNDGYPEIFVTDMLPANNERVKTVTTFDSWERYQQSVANGYWHQFTRNTLQYNNGDNTFSEIGRYAGLHASDWSWAALMFDFQNDGMKDVFISNGISQDLTDQDFLQKASQEQVIMRIITDDNVDFETLIGYIPSKSIPNHAYINHGDLTFTNKALELGLGEPSFSNGAAYGDLDNDGDLDLVINNTNMTSFLYENHAEQLFPENHYLRLVLEGDDGNTNALGATIALNTEDSLLVIQHLPARGFQSTMDPRPLIGVGNHTLLKSVEVTWPSGKVTTINNVNADQELRLKESDGIQADKNLDGPVVPLYLEVDSTQIPVIRHVENEFIDFNRERLIFQMSSAQGPCLCVGDINNDGLEDVFMGGATGYAGSVYAQDQQGKLSRIEVEEFDRTRVSEDVDCALFDADGDGNLDLYVASGGSEFSPLVPELNDRLFKGHGNFQFSLVRKTLPANKFESSSVVEPADFDQDGDMDLFVGIRLKPYYYGEPTNGYLLENDGSGDFTNVSNDLAPELTGVGMITDADWSDLDGDGDLDLIVVGEWMPIAIFLNENGHFVLNKDLIPGSSGWWNTVQTADLNGDGFMDIVAGNHGLNSRFKASEERPLQMFVKDFDLNGIADQIICQYEGEALYPLALKHDLENQIPSVGRKYKLYADYKEQQIYDVFSAQELESATQLTANDLSTSVYLGDPNLTFTKVPLPIQVQFSNVMAISIEDYNQDGHLDILLGGNMYQSKPEMGRYDASYGSLLLGNGSGEFNLMSPSASGLKLDKAVREIKSIASPTGARILVGNNNDRLQVFRNSAE
jgi:hypothetical protein